MPVLSYAGHYYFSLLPVTDYFRAFGYFRHFVSMLFLFRSLLFIFITPPTPHFHRCHIFLIRYYFHFSQRLFTLSL